MKKYTTFTRVALLIFIVSAMLFSCKPAKEKLSDDIKSSEAKLYADSMKTLNKNAANDVLLQYVSYADRYKDDTLSAEYLFRAGDLANGLHRPDESIALFERLRMNYPDYRKTPAALFMQAFIYETVLQNKEKAKEKYAEFINKYPNHHLFADATASLQQLNSNMSDEDLIKMFEEKNKGK